MKKITIDFPGLSLLEVRNQFSDCFYKQTWFDKEPFANKKIAAGKWEVSLEPVKDSLNKNWAEQIALTKDEVPPIAVLVYAICKHFKDTGERAFEDVYVRTSSLDSDGSRVSVGSFSARGLHVRGDWDYDRYSRLGLASARKLETGALEPLEGLNLESAILMVKEAGYVVYKPV